MKPGPTAALQIVAVVFTLYTVAVKVIGAPFVDEAIAVVVDSVVAVPDSSTGRLGLTPTPRRHRG